MVSVGTPREGGIEIDDYDYDSESDGYYDWDIHSTRCRNCYSCFYCVKDRVECEDGLEHEIDHDD